jgi:hypothetical protein
MMHCIDTYIQKRPHVLLQAAPRHESSKLKVGRVGKEQRKKQQSEDLVHEAGERYVMNVRVRTIRCRWDGQMKDVSFSIQGYSRFLSVFRFVG